jgi:phosphate transport system substrate-binding protein
MKRRVILGSLFVLLNCLFFNVSAETVIFSGSGTVQKRVLEPNIKAIKAATGIQVGIKAIGSGRGFQELVDGKVVASIASSSLQSLLSKSGMKDDGVYQQHTIIDDIISPVVHASNPVDELSWEQLTAIFSGEIVNWKEVGGNDMPIKVVIGKPGTATRNVFQKKVMGGKDFTDKAYAVDVTTYEINFIAANPGGIGAVSQALVMAHADKLKAVNAETISRPLAVITKGTPTASVQKVIDFLRTPEASKNFK